MWHSPSLPSVVPIGGHLQFVSLDNRTPVACLLAAVQRDRWRRGAAVPPRSAIRRARRRRGQQKGRLGRPLTWRGRDRWGCGATGSPAPGALCFSACFELPWGSGPWCFARRTSTGPWAGGRLLTAMYMAPAVGWALPWHGSCLCAGSATAKPSFALAFCEGPAALSILHQLLEWASAIEQRSNIKTWLRAS